MLLRNLEKGPGYGGPDRESHEYTYAERRCEVGEGIGVIVHGYKQPEDDVFVREYYFPYGESATNTPMESGYVRRHGDKEAYSVLSEEYTMGSALIFYLTNGLEYREREDEDRPTKLRSFSLTGLSVTGKILLPIYKTEKQIARIHANMENRARMMEAARNGDELAIESLTMDDLNLYGQISQRMRREDIYSIVDTCFMPIGVECDSYMVIGEILQCDQISNQWTGDVIYRLVLSCNGVQMTVYINALDLVGEPKVGRRFKGDIWLQAIGHFED